MKNEEYAARDVQLAQEAEQWFADKLKDDDEDQAFASTMAVLSMLFARKIVGDAPGNLPAHIAGHGIMSRHIWQFIQLENERGRPWPVMN